MSKDLRESVRNVLTQKTGLETYETLKKIPLSLERVGKAFVTSLNKPKKGTKNS